MLRLAALALALPALAASPNDDDDLATPNKFATEDNEFATRALFATLTDLRFGVTTDVLGSHGTLFVGADRGLVQLGSGILGVGLELAGGQCVTACGNFTPNLAVNRRMAMGGVRAVYHLMVSGSASALSHLGFYLLAQAGAAFAFVDERRTTGGATSVVSGTTWAPYGTAGAGASYFWGNSDFMFAGGEFRATFMPGFNLLSSVPLSPEGMTALGGFGFVLYVGLRL
jgi:hypothetical protein